MENRVRFSGLDEHWSTRHSEKTHRFQVIEDIGYRKSSISRDRLRIVEAASIFPKAAGIGLAGAWGGFTLEADISNTYHTFLLYFCIECSRLRLIALGSADSNTYRYSTTMCSRHWTEGFPRRSNGVKVGVPH